MPSLRENIDVFKPYMNNLFIAENLKIITKLLPILKIQIHQNEISLVVKRNHLIPVLIFLKNHIKYQFKILTCISGVDYPSHKYRFKVVYELLSVRYNIRIRVKVLTNELMPIESCCNVYPAAGWYESETWDMLGIFFTNHVNLTRLLTDYGFEGYPLRKDFPLSGFVESSYDYTRKRVTNERVELSQEYRSFKFTSPWETLELN
jgi:NADH dehydrogenase (ubiquinone) Fe-S protein 3